MAIAEALNRRAIERFRLHPMYTRVVVFRTVTEPPMEGHAYDISLGGMRYELDEAIPEGTCIDLEIQLPGASIPIRGSGQVVRVFDRDDDPGPRRQAVRLDRFLSEHDRQRLARLIDDGWCGRPR
jgi:hypothetical protein